MAMPGYLCIETGRPGLAGNLAKLGRCRGWGWDVSPSVSSMRDF